MNFTIYLQAFGFARVRLPLQTFWWLGTIFLTFFGFPTFISDFVRLCPTLSDFVRLCPKWFPNWCRRLFHSEMDRDRAPVAPLMFPTIFLERTYLGMFTEAVYNWVSGGHCPIIETIQVQLPYNWNNSSYNSCMIRVDAGRPWRPVAKHKTWNSLVHPRISTNGDFLRLIFGVSLVIFAPVSSRMFRYTLWDCPFMYSLIAFQKCPVFFVHCG